MLSKIIDSSSFSNHKVIYFRSSEYPVSFFRLFFKYLKREQGISATQLFIERVADWQMHQASLEVSFLGSSSYYWLRKITLDAKNRKKVYEYLSTYVGPHTIFIFVDAKDTLPTHNGLEINLDLKNKQLVEGIAKLLPAGNHYRVVQFIKKSLQICGQLSIDQICTLMQYGTLVRDVDRFNSEWLHKIVYSDQSLFELSKHFLFRDSASFYKAWVKVCDSYAPQFWIAFFSEQLFRAYYFIMYQKENNYRLAKQVSFRLPFDFTKSGWRYMDLSVLKKSHNLLYQVDYQLKNGGSDIWLDLFINQFLVS